MHLNRPFTAVAVLGALFPLLFPASIVPGASGKALPDSEKVSSLLRRAEIGLKGDWRGGIVEQGSVQPGQFAPGDGIHAVLTFHGRGEDDSNPYDLATIHLWFMKPSYEPLRVRPACPPEARTRYLGPAGPFHIYFRTARDASRMIDPHSVRESLGGSLGIDPKSLFNRISRDLEGGNRASKLAALDALYLVATHSDLPLWEESGVMLQRGLPALRKALIDDEALKKHLSRLCTKDDIVAAVPRMGILHDAAGRPFIRGVLYEAVKERPDLTDAIYRNLLPNLGGRVDCPPDECLRMMRPPSHDAIQAVLKSKPVMENFSLDALAKAAAFHAMASRCPGVGLEMAAFLQHRDPQTREAALEYFRHVRNESTAMGLMRWFLEPRKMSGRFDYRPAYALRLLWGSYLSSRKGTLIWIESGHPWRGELDLFCTLPFSETLKTDILEMLESPDPKRLRDRSSSQNVATLLALNFLIRNPVREALPRLLPLLGMGPAPADHNALHGKDSESLFRRLAFNRQNLTSVYAAQAIIRIGPDVSPDVLDYLKKRIARGEPRPPGAGLSDIELGLLILGCLADEKVGEDFAELGTSLEEVYPEVWEVADRWFQQGGRAFHVPRPPWPSVAARVEGKPGPRIVSFPTKRAMGELYIRDWGSTGTTLWERIPGRPYGWKRHGLASGNRPIPAGMELKLDPWQGEASIWQKAAQRAGINVDTRDNPPDLPLLPALKPNDLQELDLAADPIGDDALTYVRGLTMLHKLYLGKTQVSDKGLAQLKPLTSLETLDLSKTAITDKGLANLAALKSLRVLDLGGTNVTDAGVPHLVQLKTLRTLYIGETKISRAGFETLRKALPQCEIWR